MEMSKGVTNSDAERSMSTDSSANAAPLGASTPTGTVVVPGPESSSIILG